MSKYRQMTCAESDLGIFDTSRRFKHRLIFLFTGRITCVKCGKPTRKEYTVCLDCFDKILSHDKRNV